MLGTWDLGAVGCAWEVRVCHAGTEGTTIAVAGPEAELPVQLMGMSGPGWSWVLGASVGAWGHLKQTGCLHNSPHLPHPDTPGCSYFHLSV